MNHLPMILVLGLIASGCSGRVSLGDDGTGGDKLRGADAGRDAEPSPVTDTASPTIDSSSVAAVVDDGTGCQVVQLFASSFSDGGPTIYTNTLSDPDPAVTLAYIESNASSMFTVTCLAGSEVRLRATFGPYAGFGEYPLPIGALVLGGLVSDRVCTVGISEGSAGALRGFISCPREPYSDDNVFSRSTAPIGLGAFDAKP